MLRTKLDLRKAEEATLAPYAHFDSNNAGRQYPEHTHPFRTDFQRDRDRILHSHAFRRLEYKTQVFLSGSGDHLRNRLTHTIEVAAIARTIARALAVNEDLTETIALAHDLGHPPFGHAGERAISKVMKDHGGFDHNLQALRVVDVLEIKYPQYDGINLTRDVRSGLLKHPEHRIELDGMPLSPRPSLEAQIADLADDLTYYGHDVDDGLDSGLITEDQLKNITIWQEAADQAKAYGLAANTGERFSVYTVRCLIDNMVGDAIRYSAYQLERYNPQSADEAEHLPLNMISFSPDYLKKTLELKEFLYENLYFGKILDKLNGLSLSRIEFLFETFCKDPSLMGETARSRLEKDGVERTVADYIAGMTDNFALMEYLRLHP